MPLVNPRVFTMPLVCTVLRKLTEIDILPGHWPGVPGTPGCVEGGFSETRCDWPSVHTPCTKPIHAEKHLGELSFARIHAGLYSHSREYRKICLRSYFRIFVKFLGNSSWCEYMPRLYSHLRKYRKLVLRDYLRVGCVRGHSVPNFCFRMCRKGGRARRTKDRERQRWEQEETVTHKKPPPLRFRCRI